MLRYLIPVLLIAAPALAAPPRWVLPVLEASLAAHDRGDHVAARRGFVRLASQGSAIAETMLGVMAADGQGQRRDPASAATWWMRAANRGYPPAQLALAEALARGEGLARDNEAAWVWARLASTHGDAATATRARLLARRLHPRDPATLARLDKRRLAWRPWATLAG